MTIDWLAFLAVFASAIVGACLVTVLFAGGIRLFATPPVGAGGAGAARDEEMDDVEGPSRPASATTGGVVLFALSGVAVLIGIYLIVPALHGG